jgi:hypothetical protein
MNNEHNQTPHLPGWLRLWIAISSGVLAFRIVKVAWFFGFWWMSGVEWLIPVNRLFHRWDGFLVTGLAIVTAIVAARWVESKCLKRGRCFVIVSSILCTLLALAPFELQIQYVPAMPSPLLTAVRNGSSPETVSALIDRYPDLFNSKPGKGVYLLTEAAYQGKTNIVELLVQRGADVDQAISHLQVPDDSPDFERAVLLILNAVQKQVSPHGQQQNIIPGQ